MASSSLNVHNESYRYDVFLSFCGEDTRKTFVDHLYVAFEQHSICTFKDDERLKKGKRISDELLQSIEDSRLYIIVFSKNYASSSWCLNELLKIMECHKMNGQTAFPVFYDVDPSEVRKQTGSVGKAFAIHSNKNKLEVEKWRGALKAAADLSGWDVRKTANGHEAKVIKFIIEHIALELRPIDIGVDKNLTGIEQRIHDLNPCLELGINDVRMIGIKGMGGAGKTTLAWAIYDKISFNFEGKSFVENVRERTSQFGLNKLQEQILKDVLNEGISVQGVQEGRNIMRKKLCGKKILLVLDDVDHKYQLEMLAGDTTWFKPGSRIIITTRDRQVLEAHRVKVVLDVNLLSDEEAICLFSRHAFGKDIPNQGYERHSRKVVSYAAGLPLTIKVLGSDLCGKDDSEWTNALERLKTIPLKETLNILELSYANLEDDHKQIFLDVACFLRYEEKDKAIRILESCGFYAKYGLRVLEQKSLIVTSIRDNRAIIDMHDHLAELGSNIVRREHADEPNKHSRLWVQEEIEHVLASDSDSEAVRCIALNITPEIVLEGLEKMNKLRCLLVKGKEFDYDCIINEACQYFPISLQCLFWRGYPHWHLPKTFEANNLVALEMPDSKIEQLWGEGKVMKKLKFLNLGYTKLITLDLRLTPNLERLDLRSCEYLQKLDVHSGCLKSLVYLNLSYCTLLESLEFIEQLESLEVLDIDGQVYMTEFPDYITTGHSINSLRELHLLCNKIEEVPSSIGNLHKLVSLELNCHGKILPRSICSLRHLRTLALYSTTGIEELPGDLGQLECLENLDLRCIKVKHLPGSICMLKYLKTLFLYKCELLEKLPEDVGQLESLEKLDLLECTNLRDIPSSICKLKHLKELKLVHCKRLEKLPDKLADIECLQLLDIQCTSITHLPPTLKDNEITHDDSIEDDSITSASSPWAISKVDDFIHDDSMVDDLYVGTSQKLDLEGWRRLRNVYNIRATGVTHLP
ncbi:putative TIR domain, P-loop containing nucleoside triphosphate hydrolase [Helianthus annuus]|nr:putative TIR domain, P-loop containing nucleoside triphosphate hydrolase [Helianthus annuus]